jgi:MoaA/NifB/PqqE/SkfB family radical SAM enzyme
MTVRKTVAFSKNSSNLFFHILTRCNLRCRHCYINPQQQGEKKVSFVTIKAWLDEFASISATTNVIFLGGEPTLHPDLPAAIKYARDGGFSSITVDTNGYLFHDIISKVSPQEVDFFSFSLDGATRETNDNIRGEGSYDICKKGIQKALDKGFAASLIYTVSTMNIHELELMPSLIKKLGVNRFFIQVIGLRGKVALIGRTEDSKDTLQVSRSKWLEVIPAVARNVAELGVIVSYPKVFLKPEDQFECAGLVAQNYFIFPNGRVYRCPLCEDHPIHSRPLCEDHPIHSRLFKDNKLIQNESLNESDLFKLNIPEGCVMNKLIQPQNLSYTVGGVPEFKIACCLLKEEITPM